MIRPGDFLRGIFGPAGVLVLGLRYLSDDELDELIERRLRFSIDAQLERARRESERRSR